MLPYKDEYDGEKNFPNFPAPEFIVEIDNSYLCTVTYVDP